MADNKANDLKIERKKLEIRKLAAEARQAEADADRADMERETQRFALAYQERQEKDRIAKEGLIGFFDFRWEVHEGSVELFTEWLDFHKLRRPKHPVTIRISSPGGSIFAGFQMMDQIRDARNAGHKVTVKVTGMAASMAGVIAQSADKRLVGKDSYLMLHTASQFSFGNYKTFELKDQAKLLEKLTKDCVAAYANRSGGKWTAEALYERIERTEWWIPAEEAVREGFADGVF